MSMRLNVSTVSGRKQLFFLHGWGVDSGVWKALLDIFKSEFCITTINMTGYRLNKQQLTLVYSLHNA